jgi:hypothetical protein
VDESAADIAPLLRIEATDNDDIGGKAQATKLAAKAHGLVGSIGDFGLDNEKIDIAMRVGLPTSVGAEQDHFRPGRSLSQAAARLSDQRLINDLHGTRIVAVIPGVDGY